MEVLNFFKKVKDFGVMVKLVASKVDLLLVDNDHNGKPDIVDALDRLIDLVKTVGVAHFAQIKQEAAQVGELLKEIKVKLEKLK